MTDTPGPAPEGKLPADAEPEPEQRLPAVRPPVEPAPVERFSSPPSTRTFELTAERAAQVVRQSSNARWVGFLAVIVVILFVAIYWFYELGLPGGLSEPRLKAEVDAQQVTSVERGYNLYEANCARCHGANGEGGIGPKLNSQEKLFAHLSEDYLRNMLTVGGRYACGDPNSLMPIWSDQGHPPGPLNYKQVQDIVTFIRAPSTDTYVKRDPELLDPKIDPLTGKIETFQGWRDPDYAPAPGATPYPACWKDEFAAPASGAPASASASGEPAASAGASGAPAASAAPSGAPAASAAPSGAPAASAAPSGGAGGAGVDIAAQNIAYTTTDVKAPAGQPFIIHFDNEDAGTPHNVEIKDGTGAVVFKGDIFPGVATKDYSVPALAAGTYPFVCSVHANMTGTLTAG